MIALKSTVSLKGLRVQTWAAVTIAGEIWERYNLYGNNGVTVTSANDGEHDGHPVAGEDKDPHYTGRAVDLRLHDLPVELRTVMVAALTDALGTNGFQVLHESIGADNEHVHIQYIEPD